PRARVAATAARIGIVVDRHDFRRGCWESAPARALNEKRQPERTERQPEKIARCHFFSPCPVQSCSGVRGEIPLWKSPATFRVTAGYLRVLPTPAMRRAARWAAGRRHERRALAGG